MWVWLGALPDNEVHDQRVARTVQLLAVLTLAWSVAAFVMSGPGALFRPFGLAQAIIGVATVATLALIRRGMCLAGTWTFVLGLTGAVAVAFIVGGLTHGYPFGRVLALPLVVAALVLGTRGLWAVFAFSFIALVISAARDAGFLGAAPAFSPVRPIVGLLPSVLITLLFLAIALDGLGTSLHRSLRDLCREVATSSQLSRRLAADERRWRTFLDGVRLLVIGTRPDGIVDYVNPWFCEVSGYAADELLGTHVHTLAPASERREPEQYGSVKLTAGDQPPMNPRLLTREGRERLIAWSTVIHRDAFARRRRRTRDWRGRHRPARSRSRARRVASRTPGPQGPTRGGEPVPP